MEVLDHQDLLGEKDHLDQPLGLPSSFILEGHPRQRFEDHPWGSKSLNFDYCIPYRISMFCFSLSFMSANPLFCTLRTRSLMPLKLKTSSSGDLLTWTSPPWDDIFVNGKFGILFRIRITKIKISSEIGPKSWICWGIYFSWLRPETPLPST